MKTFRLAVCLTCLFGLGLTSSAWAIDVVYRRSSDTSLQGEITEVTKTEVVVKKRIGSPEKVPANDIINIRWDGEPAKLNLARSAELAGRLTNALEMYQEVSTDSAAKKENIRKDIEFLIARTNAKIALNSPDKVDDAIGKLEKYRQANGNSYREYDALNWLGQLYAAKKDYQKAAAMFTLMAAAPWADTQMAAENANARIKLQQDDVSGALAAFEKVASMPAKTPAEQTRQFEAQLGKASCLMKQGKSQPALTVLQEVTDKAPPEASALQAEAFVRQGDCYQALGQTKLALLAYLRVDVLFAKETQWHPEALYHLARLWSVVGSPDRAAEARATLESDYAESPWTKRLGSNN